MNLRTISLIALVNLGLIAMSTGHGGGLGLIVPLLPIAAITGHAGLLGSGLAGPALLKLKAAAALGALLALKKGHVGFHFNVGHGGHHESGNGWGWRRRRSVDSDDARGETVDIDMAQYDPSLDEVLSYDQLGCGLRLVCELSATPDAALLEDEKLILELFGRDVKVPSANKASRGKLSYSYAALLGGNAKDASACNKVYGRCPYSGKQVMQSLRDAQV
jgi:hypothetical protein